jgi:hypothetical protein
MPPEQCSLTGQRLPPAGEEGYTGTTPGEQFIPYKPTNMTDKMPIREGQQVGPGAGQGSAFLLRAGDAVQPRHRAYQQAGARALLPSLTPAAGAGRRSSSRTRRLACGAAWPR